MEASLTPRSRSLGPLVLIGGLLLTSTAAAQEWTRFRGPNGAGQSEAEFPAQWTERDFVWKAALPGVGFSSPVLWGQKIFLTSAQVDKKQRSLLCLSAADGSLLWKKDFPFYTYPSHAQNGYASSTPVVDARHVYCTWAVPEKYYVVALDHEGEQVWRADIGPFNSMYGYAASPMIYQDLLIVPNDQNGQSSLQAFDCADGKLRWRIPRRHSDREQNASYSVPCMYQPPDGPAQLIHNSWGHGITSLDPLNGTINWEIPALDRRSITSPITVDGLIFGNCGDGEGKKMTVAVRPGVRGGKPPEVAYKFDKLISDVPTMISAGHLVFLWSEKGIVACIDAPTGQIHYRERVGGTYHGSPVRAGSKLFCISLDGEVVALAAADKFEVLGRTPLNETSGSTPAIVGDRMYVRTESHLLCVQGKK